MLFNNKFSIFVLILGILVSASTSTMEHSPSFSDLSVILKELDDLDLEGALRESGEAPVPTALGEASRLEQARGFGQQDLVDEHFHILKSFYGKQDHADTSLWYNMMLWPVDERMAKGRQNERNERREDLKKCLKSHNLIRLTKEGPHIKYPLHEAVQKGLVDTIVQLVCWGADVNFPNFQGSTPLHMLARIAYQCDEDRNKACAIALYLLAHDGDANKPNNSGDSPLCWVIDENRHELVSIFLQHGAQANKPAHLMLNKSPLERAAQFGYYKIVDVLLDNFAGEYEDAFDVASNAIKGFEQKKELSESDREKIRCLEKCLDSLRFFLS